MGFKEDYLKLHNERNMSDDEIMGELNIHRIELYRLKKYYKIKTPKRPRKNYQGFTEEMLRKGEEKGLSRRLMYKRVRCLNWSHERAITEPNNKRKKVKKDD